jgi:aldose 1-epimerase
MRFISATFAASVVGSALAKPGPPPPDTKGRYTLEADGIKAQFIPYGATLTNLWVKGMPNLSTTLALQVTADMVQTRAACSEISC